MLRHRQALHHLSHLNQLPDHRHQRLPLHEAAYQEDGEAAEGGIRREEMRYRGRKTKGSERKKTSGELRLQVQVDIAAEVMVIKMEALKCAVDNEAEAMVVART